MCELNELEKILAAGIKCKNPMLMKYIDDNAETTYRIKTEVNGNVNYLRVSFKNKDYAFVLNALVNEFNRRNGK